MAGLNFSSGLGRSLDLRYASNRFAVALGFGALFSYVAVAAFDGRFGFSQAGAASIAVFLAWAIGRELDPDRPVVAAVAGLGAYGAAFFGLPAALVTYAALIAARGVAGTTGRSIKHGDLIGVAAAGFGSGGAVWSWPIALVMFVWLKSAPDVGRRRWWAIAALTVGFTSGWYLGDLDAMTVTPRAILMSTVVVIATVMATVSVVVTTSTDSGRAAISAMRVRYARLATGVIVVSAITIGGEEVVWQVAPVTAAIVATGALGAARWIRLADVRSAGSTRGPSAGR